MYRVKNCSRLGYQNNNARTVNCGCILCIIYDWVEKKKTGKAMNFDVSKYVPLYDLSCEANSILYLYDIAMEWKTNNMISITSNYFINHIFIIIDYFPILKS